MVLMICLPQRQLHSFLMRIAMLLCGDLCDDDTDESTATRTEIQAPDEDCDVTV